MYGGELIHQTSDSYGSIEVIDYQGVIRSMHFGNKTQQSASLLCNPFFLVHNYAQAMLLPLCWQHPSRVLVLGLGSGSIVKYLYNYFQDINIDTIELRKKVIDIASQYFCLPDPDNRLTIYNESIDEWLNRENICKKYDLVLVDVFLTSSTGKDITVDVSEQLDKIAGLLTDNGIIVFNQLGSDYHLYPGFNPIFKKFKNHLYSIDVKSANSILIASKSNIPDEIEESIFEEMQSRYSLPCREYFNALTPVKR